MKTKLRIIVAAMTALCFASASSSAEVKPIRGLEQVNHANLELQGGFWGLRQDMHHNVTVPHALDCLEKVGHVTNFDKASGKFDGPLRGHHAFDSDIHKALEGALYSLRHYEDKQLSKRVESIIDHIDGIFGEGKRYDVGGHQEIELALIKLYRVTGDRRYLELSKFFLDERGHVHGTERKRFDPNTLPHCRCLGTAACRSVKLLRTQADPSFAAFPSPPLVVGNML
jgi:DUF1680 family protein